MVDMDKTRTEIIKEKFEDKELTAEQMEEVVGGSDRETQLDSYFLNYMLGDSVCPRWDGKPEWGGTAGSTMVKHAWRKVGVEVVMYPHDNNTYYLHGNQITRRQAFEHAQKVLGKRVTDSDWMEKK